MQKTIMYLAVFFISIVVTIVIVRKNTVSKNEGLSNITDNFTIQQNTAPKVTPTRLYGIWEWRFDTSSTQPETLKEELSQLQQAGVQVIYLTVDELITIGETVDPAQKKERIIAYYPRLAAYIQTAAAYGIKVEALAGGKEWALSSHRYLATLTVDEVVAYNAENPTAQLQGIQFDIEPFSLTDFATDSTSVSKEFLLTAEAIVKRAKTITPQQDDFFISFAVPYWLEGSNGNIAEFVYNGKNGFLMYHLVDVLSSYQSSYLILMSYRNTAEAVIGITAKTATYLEENKSPVKFVVGQELNDEEPVQITYYDMSWNYLNGELQKINDHFQSNPQYQGIAIHELKSYVVKNLKTQ